MDDSACTLRKLVANRKGRHMAKRKMHGVWVLYLLPIFFLFSFTMWLMRDVLHWF